MNGLQAAFFGLTAVPVACAQLQHTEDEPPFVDLGHVDASRDPPPGIALPVELGDLAALQQRGRLLFDMSRALELGTREGPAKVGYGEGEVILPLVAIDPGGRSAEVVFLRWRRDAVGPGGTVAPKDAERWLRVSLLLSPDRVLDVELLAGEPVERSEDTARAQAIIAAAQALRERTPKESYGMYAVIEQASARQAPAVRVYALSISPTGADYEIVVEPPVRTERVSRSARRDEQENAPRVIAIERVHGVVDLAHEPARIERPEPAAAAVTRVMQRGPLANDVVVSTPSGRFRISPREGRIVRESPVANPA